MKAITDLAWSPDAQFLMVSSRDDYCSIVHFEPDDLGTPLDVDQLQYENKLAFDRLMNLDLIRKRGETIHRSSKTSVKPSIEAQPHEEAIMDETRSHEETAINEASKKKREDGKAATNETRVRRRITPIAVTSFDEPSVPIKERPAPQLFSATTARESFFNELREFAHLRPPLSSKPETQSAAEMDLLAMTRKYAQSRFG